MKSMRLQPHVSVVVPVRNRSGVRLRNCLRSLAWQEGFENGAMEVVVSDFGSDARHQAEIAEASASWGAYVEYTETDDIWSRPRALNRGIRASRGRLVLCTDVDMIFAPNFVVSAVEAVDGRDGEVMALCQSRDLPQDSADAEVDRGAYEAYLARTELRPQYGMGACQCAPRAWFERVRGYDEGFRWWGYEDQDMVHRARKSGLEPVWITAETSMLHQWHPKQNTERRLQIKLNQWRYRLLKPVVRRNPFGWGEPG